MPVEGVDEQWRKLIREAFKTGDLRRLRADVAKLAERQPEEYWAVAWHRIADDLGNLVRFLASAPPDGTPMVFAVAIELLRIAEDANSSRGRSYVQYVDDSREIFQYDVELAMKLAPDPRRFLPRVDMTNVGDVLERYEDLMATYKRRLAYVSGLLDLIDGREPSIARLASQSITFLESRVRDHPAGMGNGMVLGEDYSHVRNAIAHRTYVIARGSRTIRFRDERVRSKRGSSPTWEREVPYAEFASMYLYATFWLLGWMVGHTFERAELVSRAYAGVLASKSKRS